MPDGQAQGRVRYRATHVTTYAYADAVASSHQLLHLTPRPLPTQRVLATQVTVDPVPAVWTSRRDYFGNEMVQFTIEERHHSLVLEAVAEVEITSSPRRVGDGPEWERVRDGLDAAGPDALDAHEFVFDSILVPTSAELAAYAEPSFTPGRPIVSALTDLNRRIHRDFTFDPQATTLATPLVEVLATRRGVCQDFAHLMIGCLRSIGLAARYVSGYLRTNPPPGRPRLVGADASHAWISAWVGDGWLDLDPTNDCLPVFDHITLAWGRDYDDVAPVRGIIDGGGSHTLTVAVDVLPLDAPEPRA
jgi:transglutaminase-like putative cysteine protease